MQKKRKYKYIHLLYGKNNKFSGPLVQLINDPENGFQSEVHLFVTPYSSVYEDLKEYENVELNTSGKNLYHVYCKQCDWLISHGAESKVKLLFTRKAVLKKTIYRYWGGSRTTHITLNKKKIVEYLLGQVKICAFKRTIGSFAAIGVGNTVDVIDLSKLLDKMIYYRMPYNYTDLALIDQCKAKATKKDIVNVLLGHRGTSENNHIEILNILEKYQDENIHIFIPLSYGNETYIEGVKEFVASLKWKNKITVINDFMQRDEYIKFLSKMDIAIFDGYTSYALGNIALLLSLEKTIFLNKSGVISEAFCYEKVPCKYIDDIKQLDFSSFSMKIVYQNKGNNLQAYDKDYNIAKWKEVFEAFE